MLRLLCFLVLLVPLVAGWASAEAWLPTPQESISTVPSAAASLELRTPQGSASILDARRLGLHGGIETMALLALGIGGLALAGRKRA